MIAPFYRHLDGNSSILINPDIPGDLVRALPATAKVPLNPVARAASQRAKDYNRHAMTNVHLAGYRSTSRKQ